MLNPDPGDTKLDYMMDISVYYCTCDISQAISIAMARAIAYISLRWWLEP